MERDGYLSAQSDKLRRDNDTRQSLLRQAMYKLSHVSPKLHARLHDTRARQKRWHAHQSRRLRAQGHATLRHREKRSHLCPMASERTVHSFLDERHTTVFPFERAEAHRGERPRSRPRRVRHTARRNHHIARAERQQRHGDIP